MGNAERESGLEGGGPPGFQGPDHRSRLFPNLFVVLFAPSRFAVCQQVCINKEKSDSLELNRPICVFCLRKDGTQDGDVVLMRADFLGQRRHGDKTTTTAP